MSIKLLFATVVVQTALLPDQHVVGQQPGWSAVRVAQACHPNYEGACVPIASDVDCAGGSGNGPAYVRGPLRVVGPDVYDLDRDGDGVACDK